MEVSGGPPPLAGTLKHLFFEAAERFDKPDALQAKSAGKYRPISHRVVLERVRHVARGLRLADILRRSCRYPFREPAGVGDRGLRLPHRRPDRRAALSDAARRSDRVHPS